MISKRQKAARRRRDEKNQERWHAKQAEAALRREMRLDATDIFVDANKGNDQNDGLTSDTPFNSLQAAMDSIPKIFDQNVTLHLAAGIFKIPSAQLLSGVVLSDHATLILDGGGNAVIDGGSK